MEQIFFYIFAIIAVIAAVSVVLARNPIHSTLFLIVCLLQVAALFVLLRSPFLAAVQVFVYVGAVMVLFLFAVLVLGVGNETFGDKFHGQSIPAFIALGALFVVSGLLMFSSRVAVPGAPFKEAAIAKNTEVIGRALYTKYIFPFEVVSLLLLIALVGTVVLVMKEKTKALK